MILDPWYRIIASLNNNGLDNNLIEDCYMIKEFLQAFSNFKYPRNVAYIKDTFQVVLSHVGSLYSLFN